MAISSSNPEHEKVKNLNSLYSIPEFIRLDSEGLHYLYASLNIITMIKSGRVMWAEYVARTGDEK
jgi:hypothetical protein